MTRTDAVERWAEQLFAPEPPECRRARELAAEQELPAISITPHEGKLLQVLLRSAGCRRVLEIGTLSGYSALWMLDALPADGHLHTIEMDARHAEVAEAAFRAAGVGERVTLVRGRALDVLSGLVAAGPFDAVFIDADKTGYPDYLAWAEPNLRPGGLVMGHNAFAFGGLHHDPEDPRAPLDDEARGVVRAMRVFHARLADAARYESVLIPTAEGLVVGRKRS
jgi:caffeoyl-CoA O-methyltransferase